MKRTKFSLIMLTIFAALLPSIAFATDGIVVYGNFTEIIPKYRNWTGSDFSTTQEYMPSMGAGSVINWVVTKSSPWRNETAVGILDDDGDTLLYIRNNTYDTWTGPLDVATIGAANDAYRGFDISYEQESGNAIAVYENDTAPDRTIYYRTWNGTGDWGPQGTITLPGTVANEAQFFISLEPRAGSNEILMACDGSGDDITTAIWNGTIWNNITMITTNGANVNEEKYSIAWESLSGDAMVAWGAGAADTNYSIFDRHTTTWGAQGRVENRAAVVQAVWLCADPTSDYIGITMGPDSTGDLMAKMWDGSAWTTRYPLEETSAENVATKNFMCAWTKDTGTALFTYVDNGATAIRYVVYNRSSNNWICTTNDQNVSSLDLASGSNGPCTTANFYTDDVETIHLTPDPFTNAIMVLAISLTTTAGPDLELKLFDGITINEPVTTVIETNITLSTYESADFTYNKYRNDTFPNVTSLTAAPDPVETGFFVNLSVNATDDYGIREVLIEVTDPEGTKTNYTAINVTADIFYNEIINATQNGLYYFRVYATDLRMNTNSTESGTFEAVTVPWVTGLTEVPDPVETKKFINISANVADPSGVDSAVIEITFPDAARHNFTTKNSGSTYYNDTINATQNGLYIYRIISNDTRGNINNTVTSSFNSYSSVEFNITFKPPTDTGGAAVGRNYTYINVTLTKTGTSATLEWNGTNQSMSGSGFVWYLNKTDLAEGSYSYKVYAVSDEYENNVSEIRTITIDTRPPNMTFFPPTDTSGIMVPRNYTIINVSAIDLQRNIDGCILEWNNVNESMTKAGSGAAVYCLKNKTATDGTYSYKVFANDSVGNFNSTVSRTITLDATAPKIIIYNPANITYNGTTDQYNLSVNYTVQENMIIDRCWYNLDNNVNYSTNCYNTTFLAGLGFHTIYIFANDTAGNTNISSVNFSYKIYGFLVSTLINPLENTSSKVGPNRTFILRANVTCMGPAGATCGQVNGTGRYNSSGPVMSYIPQAAGEPFYATTSQNFSCNQLLSGDRCQAEWTVNATGKMDTAWRLDVLFNSTALLVRENTTSMAELNITDSDPPLVKNLADNPDPANIYNFVNISANVTDNFAVDVVVIEIQRPDTTRINVTTKKVNEIYYNDTINGTQPGINTYRIYANDTHANINSTESGTFDVQDLLNPRVNTISDAPDPVEVYRFVNISANATDNYAVDRIIIEIQRPDNTRVNYTTKKVNEIYYNDTLNATQLGVHIYRIMANDTYGNKNYTESGTFVVQDTTNPRVASLADTPDPLDVFTFVNISANVTDNFAVDVVVIEIQRPDTTRINVTTKKVNEIYYNDTMNMTQFGSHTYRVYANDTAGNKNNTESGTFVVQDLYNPIVRDLSDAPDPVEVYRFVNISANVTDNNGVDSVVIEIVRPDSSRFNSTTKKTGDIYYNDTVNTTQLGVHLYRIISNDTTSNKNNTESGTFVVQDTTNPRVTSLADAPDPAGVYNFVNVSASVTDNFVVDVVVIEIQSPSGRINYTTKNSNGVYYNDTINTTQPGIHTYRFYVNDTTGNKNNTESGTFVVQDTGSPAVTIVSPTEDDNKKLPANYTFINSTVSDAFSSIDSCLLEWDGTNESMTKSGSGTSAVCEKNKTDADGLHTYKIIANETSGNKGYSQIRHVTFDTAYPNWTNQQQNRSEIGVGEVLNLSAIIEDNLNISHVWLATNESGQWINYTNSYGSPKIPAVTGPAAISFEWKNASVGAGSMVYWRIYFNDTVGNVNHTNAMHFMVNASRLWNFTSGGMIFSSAGTGDVNNDSIIDVVIGSYDKNVYALNGTNGAVIWNYTTGGSVASSPSLANIAGNGILEVVVGSYDGKMYAFNGSDGGILWKYTTNGLIFSSPAIADVNRDGILDVVFGSADNDTYAINGTNGSKIWNYTTLDRIFSSPAVTNITPNGNRIVYIGSYDRNLYALNGTNGSKIWNYTTLDRIESSPAIGDVNGDGILEVAIGSYDRNLYLLNSTNGTLLCNYSTGNWITSSPVITNINGKKIIFGSHDSKIYALNSTCGIYWNFTIPTGGRIPSSPSIADMNKDGVNDVIIGATDGVIYAINGNSGELLWSYSTGRYIHSSVSIMDINGDGADDFVTGSLNNNIYTLDPPTGWNVFGGNEKRNRLLDESPPYYQELYFVLENNTAFLHSKWDDDYSNLRYAAIDGEEQHISNTMPYLDFSDTGCDDAGDFISCVGDRPLKIELYDDQGNGVVINGTIHSINDIYAEPKILFPEKIIVNETVNITGNETGNTGSGGGGSTSVVIYHKEKPVLNITKYDNGTVTVTIKNNTIEMKPNNTMANAKIIYREISRDNVFLAKFIMLKYLNHILEMMGYR